jgi:hypothetical protein
MAGRHCPFPPLLASSNNDANNDVGTFKELLPFPVLSKIAGVNWEGSCRYVSNEGVPASFELTGGIRFDLSSVGNDEDKIDDVGADDDSTVLMTSFVVFPDGKSREIEMRYVISNCHVVCCSRPPTDTKQIKTNTPYSIDYKYTGTSLKRIRPREHHVDSVFIGITV